MTLEQITQTQWAKLAQLKEREQPIAAVECMRRFYSQFQIAGQRADQDSVMAMAFTQTSMAAQRGHGIGGTAIGQAAHDYSNLYDEYFEQTNLRDIRQSVIDSGFTGFRTDFDAYVNANANMTFKDLKDSARAGNQDALRAANAFGVLEMQKFEVQLYQKVVTDLTNRNMQALYP
ncbi:MAG: hypothetical protein AABX71_01385 [Nanoarchaeota archaeon]